MAGEKFIELAVESIRAFMAAGFGAALDAVETARGYAANTLREPALYRKADGPVNQSPLVQIYANRATPTDVRNRFWEISCKVELSFKADADIETGEEQLAGYATALDALFNDGNYTLGSRVPEARCTGFEMGMGGDGTTTFHVLMMDVAVRLRTNA